LFLHGQFARYLNTDEVQEFFAYQRRLELWRLLEEATSTGYYSNFD
jgi:hypothetical protein